MIRKIKCSSETSILLSTCLRHENYQTTWGQLINLAIKETLPFIRNSKSCELQKVIHKQTCHEVTEQYFGNVDKISPSPPGRGGPKCFMIRATRSYVSERSWHVDRTARNDLRFFISQQFILHCIRSRFTTVKQKVTMARFYFAPTVFITEGVLTRSREILCVSNGTPSTACVHLFPVNLSSNNNSKCILFLIAASI